MEDIPLPKIVGSPSELERQEFLDQFRSHLQSSTQGAKRDLILPSNEQVEWMERIRQFELPKTPEERTLIEVCNAETNTKLADLHLPKLDIPADNIHILDAKAFVDKHELAHTIDTLPAAVLNAEQARGDRVNFARAVFHEMCHIKSARTFEFGKEEIKQVKTGVMISSTLRSHSTSSVHEHFAGLNEAIAGTLEAEFIQKIINHPLLAAEKAWNSSETAAKIREHVGNRLHMPPAEVSWVASRKNLWSYWTNYWEQRNVLRYTCEQIAKERPSEFNSAQQVLQSFYEAFFAGNLIAVGRTVETVFGKGAFRELGEMDDVSEGGNSKVVLEKLRSRVQLP